jgi:hypothetical protein
MGAASTKPPCFASHCYLARVVGRFDPGYSVGRMTDREPDPERFEELDRLIRHGWGDLPGVFQDLPKIQDPDRCPRCQGKLWSMGYKRGRRRKQCSRCRKQLTLNSGVPGSRLPAEDVATLAQLYLQGESAKRAAVATGRERKCITRLFRLFRVVLGSVHCTCGRLAEHAGMCGHRRKYPRAKIEKTGTLL